MLAQCNTGAHIRKKRLRLLFDVFDKMTDKSQSPDTAAMVVQALTCVLKHKRNRSLANILHRPVKDLKKAQKADGSFGNVHTSAVVTQALLSMPDDDRSWNATSALLFLLNQQQEDGSFETIWATSSILPILNGNSYVDIPNIVQSQCAQQNEVLEIATKKPSSTHNLLVQYSIWIGNNVTTNHTIHINMPKNTSFFDMMRHAAELDSNFDFHVATSPNGHYVKSLSGLAENTTSSQYWLLGIKKSPENNAGLQFVDVGVDDFYPSDGQHVVFWYKQI